MLFTLLSKLKEKTSLHFKETKSQMWQEKNIRVLRRLKLLSDQFLEALN